MSARIFPAHDTGSAAAIQRPAAARYNAAGAAIETTADVDSTRRAARRLWAYVVGLGLVAVVCMAVGHVYVLDEVNAALAATAIVHLASRPNRWEALATALLAGGLLFGGGHLVAGLVGGEISWPARAATALGLAGLVVQVARLARSRLPDWTSARGYHAALAMLMPMFSLAFASAIGLPGALRSGVLDAVVIAFDRALFHGHLPPVDVGLFLVAHPALRAAAAFSYWAPLPLIALVSLAERRAGIERDVMTTLLLAAFAGYLFFPFFPVVGPSFVLPHYPFVASLTPVIGTYDVSVPRNCMPSLHMATAFILAAAAWELESVAWRLFGVTYVVLTILATLGFGCHYAADLIAAVPFTVAVLAARRRRFRAALAALVVTIAFVCAVRWAVPV